MICLIRSELKKVWGRKSFPGLMALLIFLNLFFLWYLNRPVQGEPPLSAYRAVCRDISGMTEPEKLDYIQGLKEQTDGIALVEEVRNLFAQGTEAGNALARQRMNSSSGIYEKYYEIYRTGNYLTYTHSLAEEQALVNQLYEEISVVSGYDDYIRTVQENSSRLSGISIFQSGGSEESFTSRNIRKSEEDHSGMTGKNIRWFPAKGITMALENPVSDLLLLLSVFLFVGQMITEEKEKELFAVTRASRRGVAVDMAARIAALFLHCATFTFLLFGTGLLFGISAAGAGDLTAALQSVASYTESSMPVSISTFLLASTAGKAITVFCFGLLLSAFAIFASRSFSPQLAGIGFLTVNWIFYTQIPSYSGWNLLKYLSFFGLLRTDQIWGNYLNLNILGYPVSRSACSLTALALFLAAGLSLTFGLFARGRHLTLRRKTFSFHTPFRPHSSLLCHESYKLLFANRILFVAAAFVCILGWTDLERKYVPSAGEEYYQTLMKSLEGTLNEEKEALIASEQARFDEASAQIKKIDRMTADGAISESTGESMKLPWESEMSFYPAFQRVLAQYEKILENGGIFVYDTGYLYLLGSIDDSLLTDLLLLVLCICFSFSNVMALEDSRGMWKLLSATRCGRRKVLRSKYLVCSFVCIGITLFPWIFRWISISKVYPMAELLAGIQNIPQYSHFALNMPILLFLFLAALIQAGTVLLITFLVLLLSRWRKNAFQALFLALLLFAVPLILSEMGLPVIKWFSIWPLYSWTGLL